MLVAFLSALPPQKKTRGHGPAPVTAQLCPPYQSSSKSTPIPSPQYSSPNPQSSPSPSWKVAGSNKSPSRFGALFLQKNCQPIILSWSGMPSASIPKTWFLPAQKPPPFPPHRPAFKSSLLLRALRCHSRQTTKDTTLYTTTRRT